MRLALIAVFWMVCFAQGWAASPDCVGKLECAKHSVVVVLPIWPPGKTNDDEPEGSGVVVADGKLIATANHVIGPAKRVLVRTFDGKTLRASIVLRDAETDIALLRIEDTLPSFQFNLTPRMATRACAIGNSFGLDISMTCGVVSATRMSGVGFNPMEDFVQTDAAVNPGMSGGALVDENGQLIGMLSAIFTKNSDSNIGVNFAVSSALLTNVVDDFIDDGEIKFPKPGIQIRQAPRSAGISGAQVVAFEPQSEERAAGLQIKDIIISADGKRIKRAGGYAIALRLAKAEDHIDLKIMRGTELLEFSLRLNIN